MLIKASLCSDVPLPVLMRIKKPKSVCVWLRSLRVWVCACEYLEVSVGVKCVCVHVYNVLASVGTRECVCVHMRYCLCASLAQHPAQGEGLILCGLKRINFVLTLAGCGLHPYPPLLSLPGARQRRRQASGDGENEGESEHRRE